MNKRGDFELSYQTMISLVRILVLAGFTVAMAFLIGLNVAKEVNTKSAEINEVYNKLQDCVVNNNVINRGISELEINNCMGSKNYGASLNIIEENIVYYNKQFYEENKKFCRDTSFCGTFSFTDKKRQNMVTEVVISNE